MEFRILGSLEVVVGHEPVSLGGPRQQAVLVALLLNTNEVMSTDRLIETVWGDEAPVDAANTLHGYVFHLRRALEPGRVRGAPAETLVSEPGGYRLRVDPAHIDAARFERLADQGRRTLEAGDPARAAGMLGEALALWRGEPLVGFEDLAFVSVEMARLQERRIQAVEDRIEALLAAGEHRRVVEEMEPLAHRFPWRERLSELHMTALYRSGRQTDALAEYQRIRMTMVDELGLEPGPGLRALESRILDQDPTLDGPVVGHEPGRPAGNLPHSVTSFVGRDDDVERLIAAVSKDRLVTILGPGGVGKTRLAVEGAHRLRDRFGEVWFVDLAAVEDPSQVIPRSATVLDVAEEAGRPTGDGLTERLSGRSSLVILDNCEHVVAAAADMCSMLLGGCGDLTLIVTTREALNVDGERILALGPMALPPPDWAGTAEDARDWPAVELFTDRARAGRAGADIETEIASIVEICRALEGMPLALELAAARLRSMSVTDLTERIDHGFRLLTGGPRTAVSRQRTLEATIEWSYDLLDDDERIVFSRLSVFVGGFTLAAAEEVVAWDPIEGFDVVDLVGQLVDKSLVILEPDPGRYRMLEMLRQFGSDRLVVADREELRRRHAKFFRSFLAEQAPGLGGGGDPETVRSVDADASNALAAFHWALGESEAELALGLAANLGPWWELKGLLSDGRDRLTSALALTGGSEVDRARVKLAVGFIARRQGDHTHAVRFTEEAVADFRRLDERFDLAHALGRMAWVALGAGDSGYARELANEGLALAAELGEPAIPPWMHLGLGHVAHQEGDLEQAAAELAEARVGFERLENRPGWGRSLFHEALVALDRGDLREAARAAGESLRIMRESADVNGLLISVETAVRVASVAGDHETAARLEAAVSSRRQELGADPGPELEVSDPSPATLRAAPDIDATARSGGQLTLDQAVDIAMAFCAAISTESSSGTGVSRRPSSGR